MVTEDLNRFIVIGINHWNAPVEVRERFSLDREQKLALLDGAQREEIYSLFVVSTCNRTELFAREVNSEELIRLLTTYSGGSLDEFHKYGFIHKGSRALEHLFSVSTGLDSQILGDLQVVNQVKEGYELSSDQNMIDGPTHRLMQHVFRAHKRSRNETSLGNGAATVAYAAVKFAVRTFDNLTDKHILLVGTGKIGKVTCRNLINIGAGRLTLVNRTRDRAAFVAEKFNVEVADMDHLPEQISRADLVIVATGASEPVIRMEHMEQAISNPKFRVMLDLSVPRNIDPEVGDLHFVDVANMDMLSDVTDEAYRKREKEVPLVKKIIEEETEQYTLWLQEQRVVPTIKALIRKFDSIRDEEMDFFRHKISGEDVDKVENLTRRIVNKIAAFSIEHLREHHTSDDVTRLIEEMYKLQTNGQRIKEADVDG